MQDGNVESHIDNAEKDASKVTYHLLCYPKLLDHQLLIKNLDVLSGRMEAWIERYRAPDGTIRMKHVLSDSTSMRSMTNLHLYSSIEELTREEAEALMALWAMGE